MWLEKLMLYLHPNSSLSNIRFNTDEHTLMDYTKRIIVQMGLKTSECVQIEIRNELSRLSTAWPLWIPGIWVPLINSLLKTYPQDSQNLLSTPTPASILVQIAKAGLISISLTYWKSQLANCWIPCEVGLLTPSSRRRIERNLDVAIISEQYAILGCRGRIWCTFNLHISAGLHLISTYHEGITLTSTAEYKLGTHRLFCWLLNTGFSWSEDFPSSIGIGWNGHRGCKSQRCR